MNIGEFDPRDLDDEDYEGMPELCDNKKKEEDTEPAVIEDKRDEVLMDVPKKAFDEEGWEDILGSGRLKKRILRQGEYYTGMIMHKIGIFRSYS